MIWDAVVSGLLGKVAPAVAEHYRQKQEQKHLIEMEQLRGKQAYEIAKTKRAEMSEGRDHEWELQRLEDARHSWKDEWVLILLSIPLVLVFIPQGRPVVEAGFMALEKTPMWYQGMIVVIFMAVFGIRKWRRNVNGNGKG